MLELRRSKDSVQEVTSSAALGRRVSSLRWPSGLHENHCSQMALMAQMDRKRTAGALSAVWRCPTDLHNLRTTLRQTSGRQEDAIVLVGCYLCPRPPLDNSLRVDLRQLRWRNLKGRLNLIL